MGVVLVGEGFQGQCIAAASQAEAAGLVVGGDDDECLLRVFLVEVVGHFDGFVQVHHFVHGGGYVVVVAGPVYFTSFDHEEEAFVVVPGQEVDGAFGDLLQCEVAWPAVDGVGQAGGVGSFFLNQHHLAGGVALGLVFVDATGQGVSGLLNLGEDAGCLSSVVCAVGFEESSACIEVESGGEHVLGNLVVHAAVGLVGVEGGRCGVVYADAGGDAYFASGAFGLFGHAGQGLFVGVDADGSVVGFRACGQGCASGGGVGDGVGG